MELITTAGTNDKRLLLELVIKTSLSNSYKRLASLLTLECKLREIIPQGSHDMFIADIVATGVDESLIDEKGSLHLGKANLSAFAHGEYFELGKTVGSFGYSVRKKKKKNVKR